MESIQNIISLGALPEEFSPYFSGLLAADGTCFIPEEGPNWDFKDQWPFSYSDYYFGGIARLACAFANARGGVIVFGVHDKKRNGGHNKVPPNLDKLSKAFAQLLTHPIGLSVRRYTTSAGDVDILLVLPITDNEMPVRFVRSIEKYKERLIWFREGHEVRAAEPRNISTLYCRSQHSNDGQDDLGLARPLPPSHATVKTFVGRMSTIDAIFEWLKMRDEPRSFLYGKGGSGKTTIAYEVAKTLAAHGKAFAINGGEILDNVMFVSAKQQSLNPQTGTIDAFVGQEFSNERELYQTLLTRGGWTSNNLESLTLEHLKKEVREFFDLTSNFIVIDDVDTLTTSGTEAGFDFLHGVLWRANRRSKVLYTLRNVGAHSIANSIEVPGLSLGGEYEEFVTVCAQQFKAPQPPANFVSGKLSVVSERRPLVIESIVALSRNAGSYDRALQLFEQHSGDDVRRYVFQREWDALGQDNYARHVLAILALNEEPLSFADLVALTRYDDGRVKDAISEVREMFLTIGTVGAETNYSLASLTSAFVLEQARKLDTFSTLRARIEQYKRNIYPENPILSRLRDRVDGLLERGIRTNDTEMIVQAWRSVMDTTISPKIAEDPRFIALQGYVASRQHPPKISDSRRFFDLAISMKYEPDFDYMKSWFYAERNTGYGTDQCVKIADYVARGKKYSDKQKLYLQSRKATVLFTRAKNDRHNTPEKSVREIYDSLKTHMACFESYRAIGDYETEKSEEFSRNTAFFLFDFLISSNAFDDYFSTLKDLMSDENNILDVIAYPITLSLSRISQANMASSDAQRVRGKLSEFRKDIDSASWRDEGCKAAVARAAMTASTIITQRYPRK